MIVLRRVEFKKARVGCCGLVRNDSITPVGYDASLAAFKKEALDIMRKYGKESYENTGDEYSVEYFEGDGTTDQNFREDGQSIFKLALEGKKWKFYELGKFKEAWRP